MRILIDGYNVMFALGRLEAGRRLPPDGLRHARGRFLNELAGHLGAIESALTTVVFDAADPPKDRPTAGRHKGLSVRFAVEPEGADAVIEALIARHSSPKALTVVSSDRRLWQAAARRKARPVGAEAFWSALEDRARKPRRVEPAPAAEDRARLAGPSAAEAAYWLDVFGAADEALAADREAAGGGGLIPSEAELDRIRREVEREGDRF